MTVKMKMMLLELLLFLCSASADVVYNYIHIHGCSELDSEDMYGLGGDEIWYTDLTNNKGVDALPDFAAHPSFRGVYDEAVKEQALCTRNLQTMLTALHNIPLIVDPPSSPVVYNKDIMQLGQKNSLICHVTGFYPAPVKIHWTKNGCNVTDGAVTNVPQLNKDGSYSQMSRLEFTPQQGEIYSCTVHHRALTKALTRFWDVDVQQPSVGPAVFCGLGLTVAVLGTVAGSFFVTKVNNCS